MGTQGEEGLAAMIRKLVDAPSEYPVADRLDALVALFASAQTGGENQQAVEVLLDCGVGRGERRALMEQLLDDGFTVDMVRDAVEQAKNPGSGKAAAQTA